MTRLEELIYRWEEETLTEAEMAELKELLSSEENRAELVDLFHFEQVLHETFSTDTPAVTAAPAKVFRLRSFAFASAAALLIAAVAGIFWITQKTTPPVGPSTFSQAFSSEQNIGLDMVDTNGEAIFAAGTIGSEGEPTDTWFTKTNLDGTVAWQRSGGTTEEEVVHCIAAYPDGGLVAVGGRRIGGETYKDARHLSSELLILRLAADGTVLWEHALGRNGNNEAANVVVTPEGDLLVTAFTAQVLLNPQGELDVADDNGFNLRGYCATWVLKFSANGDLIWQRSLDASASGIKDGVYVPSADIVSIEDGGCLITTTADGLGSSSNDNWLVRLDAQGNLVWQRGWRRAGFDKLYGAVRVDNGFLLCGQIEESRIPRPWIARIDDSGNVVRERIFEKTKGWIRGLRTMPDGSVLGYGSILLESGVPGNLTAFFDRNGQLLRALTWDEPARAGVLGTTVQVSTDGTLVLAGTTPDSQGSTSRGILMRLSADGADTERMSPLNVKTIDVTIPNEKTNFPINTPDIEVRESKLNWNSTNVMTERIHGSERR